MHINTNVYLYIRVHSEFGLVGFTKWDLVSHIVHLDFLTQYPLQIPLESLAPAFLQSLSRLPNIPGVDVYNLFSPPWPVGSHLL